MASIAPQNQDGGSHVLLTGGNGFVASHILSDLLNRGYQVTATVRSEDKALAVFEAHPSWKGRVKFAYVKDLTQEGAFDHVLADANPPFDYIIHTASPVAFKVNDIELDLINPAVQGTIGILESANKLGGSTLKRCVILGSAVSILNSFEDKTKAGKDYTEENWNPVTRTYAIENNDAVAGYNASKVEAERAAWKFIQEKKPQWDLAIVNPDIIIGPMIHPISGTKSVDVRDVARAHVDSLTNPAVSGKRILMVSGLITPQLVVNIVRKAFPQLQDRAPAGNPTQILPLNNEPTGWDTRASVKILSGGTESHQWNYIELEKSMTDAVQSMLDAGLL